MYVDKHALERAAQKNATKIYPQSQSAAAIHSMLIEKLISGSMGAEASA